METSLPFKAEYAKTGRGSCKLCKKPVAKAELKLAFMVQSRFHDGKDAHWFHTNCFFQKHRPAGVGDIEEFESLRYDDQTTIKSKLEAAPVTANKTGKGKGKGKKGAAVVEGDQSGFLASNFKVNYADSGRSTCKGCEEKILKGVLRIAKKDYTSESAIKWGKGNGLDRWYHSDCFVKIREDLEYFVAANADNLPGLTSLKKEDQDDLTKKLPAISSKRKLEDGESNDQGPAKKAKVEKDPNEPIIKEQNKVLFENRDALENGLKKPSLLQILSTNFQTIPEKLMSPKTLLDLVADIMTFGAMKKCTDCNGGQFIYKSGVGYQCTGYISEFTKCAFVPEGDVERVPFIVPDSLKDHSIFEGRTFNVTKRILPKHVTPASTFRAGTNQQQSTGPKINKTPLKGFSFVLFGITPKKEMTKLSEKIVEFGGTIEANCQNSIAAAITSAATFKKNTKDVKEAKRHNVPVLNPDFVAGIADHHYNLADEMEKYVLCDWVKDIRSHLKALNTEYEKPSAGQKGAFEKEAQNVKLKMKDGAVIDPQSGMDDGPYHVYKENQLVYNVILNNTSLEDGSNSYYKMQLIESDLSPSRYWIFRSYGRIGTTIGGTKTDQQDSLSKAKQLFYSKFKEHTGNVWGTKFEKKPGKYTSLDIEYEQKDNIEKLVPNSATSQLPLSVQRLISLIFDVDIMKQTLLEFEIDTEKMPLGKISRKQLLEAYTVLNDSFKLREKEKDERKLKRLMTDVSNRFYSLIPHSFGTQAPPLLDNDKLVKEKIEMLDNLMEIEIAYELLGRNKGEDISPIEAHYKALKAEIEVIERTSEEFTIIEKYLKNTHAPTHSNYGLHIEEAFKVNREGEAERYAPFRQLHNKRLLWHGSRVTNFAGIISQGLRIAPPEAPVTGYMFGKGIYFADIVSKSANYCWTSKSNPTGLLMLCEVALGDIHELKYANSSITKAPNNCHCVKGLGKTEPDPNELTVKNGVLIPFGKPSKSKTTDSSLLYNEYIIYDVAQVNIKYLLRCNFNYRY